MRIYLLLFFFVLGFSFLHSQNFTSPVQHEIKLAGTFGELRSNHFHMGIDIKSSNRSSGDPILAAEGGYVSRIRVSRSGYGNAIYLDHPSGYTTTYGHLRNFSERLDSVVSKLQNEAKSFEIDVDFDSLFLPVSQGEQLGAMGNSGNSYGPHLHFEIRNTKTEAPLNPMQFGLKPKDSVAPVIRSLRIYNLDSELHELDATSITPSTSSKSIYTIKEQKIDAWRVGFAINTYDPMNSGYNKNGIYEIKMLVDGEQKYQFQFDSISFDDTKYINAHIDYKHFKKTKSRFHRCFVLSGNKLPIYENSDAVIKLFQDKGREVEIQVSDFNGNTSKIEFTIRRDTVMNSPLPKIFNYKLPHTEANIVKYDKVELFFPDGSLYEDLYLYISNTQSEYLTDVYHVGDENVPLHRAVKFHIKEVAIPDSLKTKVTLVECPKKGKLTSYGGHWEGEYFISHISSFGNYALTYDTIPPTITALPSKNKNLFRYTIDDNFSSSGRAKGLDYSASIDGEWVKFKYDLKTKRISYTYASKAEGKNHLLRIEVKDDRGNVTFFEKKFIR